MSGKRLARLQGEGPFSADRSERAQMLFARYWGREALVPDVARIVAVDPDMMATDYLVGRILGSRKGIRVIGVVCEGFGIVDASQGAPQVAVQQRSAATQAVSTYRRVIRDLADLDIPGHPV